jgi:hypothetical protein
LLNLRTRSAFFATFVEAPRRYSNQRESAQSPSSSVDYLVHSSTALLHLHEAPAIYIRSAAGLIARVSPKRNCGWQFLSSRVSFYD